MYGVNVYHVYKLQNPVQCGSEIFRRGGHCYNFEINIKNSFQNLGIMSRDFLRRHVHARELQLPFDFFLQFPKLLIIFVRNLLFLLIFVFRQLRGVLGVPPKTVLFIFLKVFKIKCFLVFCLQVLLLRLLFLCLSQVLTVNFQDFNDL